MRIGNDIRVCDVSLSEGEGSPAVAGQDRIRGIQSTRTLLMLLILSGALQADELAREETAVRGQ